MNITELRDLYNQASLEDILQLDTNLGIIRMYVKDFQHVPSIPQENLVFYHALADVSAYFEKTSSPFLKHMSGAFPHKIVRATEYVLGQQPEVGVEDTAIFAQVAEAWNNAADEETANRLMTVLTALQVIACLINDDAPALDPAREAEIESYFGGGGKPREQAPAAEPIEEEQPQAVEAMTFDSMRATPAEHIAGEGATFFDVFRQSLEYVGNVEKNAEQYYQMAIGNKKKHDGPETPRHLQALYAVTYADAFLENDTILDITVSVDPHDTSFEACEYRRLSGSRKQIRSHMQAIKDELFAKDPDLAAKADVYKQYCGHKEDLSDPLANQAFLVMSWEGSVPFRTLGQKTVELEAIAKKGYAYAYTQAADINFMVLAEYARIKALGVASDYDTAPFTEGSCKTEIVRLYGEYFLACFAQGEPALRQFEYNVFCNFYDRNHKLYAYIEPLANHIVSLATCEEDTAAVACFLRMLNRYMKQSPAKVKQRERFAKSLDKPQKEQKLSPAVKIAYPIVFAALWLAAALVFPLVYLSGIEHQTVFFASIGVMAVLLAAEVAFMHLFPKWKVALRIFLPVCTLLMGGAAYFYQYIAGDCTLPLFSGDVRTAAFLFTPAAICGCAAIALSFSDAFRLKYTAKLIASFHLPRLFAFVAIYFVSINLIHIDPTFLDVLGPLNGLAHIAWIAITYILLLALTVGGVIFTRLTKPIFNKRSAEFTTTILLTAVLAHIPVLFTIPNGMDMMELVGYGQVLALVIASIGSKLTIGDCNTHGI